jgi:hypothetical protein
MYRQTVVMESPNDSLIWHRMKVSLEHATPQDFPGKISFMKSYKFRPEKSAHFEKSVYLHPLSKIYYGSFKL